MVEYENMEQGGYELELFWRRTDIKYQPTMEVSDFGANIHSVVLDVSIILDVPQINILCFMRKHPRTMDILLVRGSSSV